MNVKKSHFRIQKLSVIAVCTAMTTFAWGQAIPEAQTNMTNRGSIANTRHNMTFSGSLYQHTMDNGRNDYQEVCVYCHTPHGASTVLDVPLWNRTTRTTTYQTYNKLNDNGQRSAGWSFSVDPGAAMQPGAQSLSCLSCHDGQTAIDSIINMPGSGRYLASQQTTQNLAFLNSWDNATSGAASAPGAMDTVGHMGMNSKDKGFGNPPPVGYAVGNGTGSDGIGCLSCHSGEGSGAAAGASHDMRLNYIGTDLRNDHPIGVRFPAANGAGTDWKTPSAAGTISFFESTTGSVGLDKTDIRLYQTGLEARVECASCHDPHGVPSAGVGSDFLPMFLRVDNKGSSVCFSCHTK